MGIFSVFSNVLSGNRTRRRVIYSGLLLITLLVAGVATAIAHHWFRADRVHSIPIAVILPLTGEQSSQGKDSLQGIQLYVNSVNDRGGVNGQPLKLLIFDDQSNPDIARQRARDIVNSPALLVLGHWSSIASGAAGPIYKDGKIPAIVGTANADSVTRDNPYYFRTTYTNSEQGGVIATYIQRVLGFHKVTAVYTNDNYGLTVRDGFEAAFKRNGGDLKQIIYDRTTGDRNQQVQKVIDAIVAEPNPGMIFLGMIDTPIEDLLVPLKRRGIRAPIFVTEYSNGGGLQQYPEEQKQPGFFINGMYAAAPVIYDSASADAQDFVSTYRRVYGTQPGYSGAKYYDSARIAVEVLKAANIDTASRQQIRAQIRAQLATLNKPAVAFRSLTGPIYFDSGRNAVIPVRVGRFQQGKYISAPVQFTPVANPSLVDRKEEKSGNLIKLNDQLVWRQQVVYTGIDINQISQVDQRKSSFTTDFYLWFRYPDGADATNIKFPGGTNLALSQPLFNPDAPLETGKTDGLNYRLYQIRGEFKTPFNLRDYPFDQQGLAIQFQNTTTPSDRLIYVIDTFGLRLPQTNTEAERKPYQGLQLWKFNKLQYAQQVFRTTSTEGDPRLFGTSNRVDYPGLSATVTVQRRSVVFLVKNLLPLFLLMLVPMATLYFPDKISKDRPPVAVAALISGTVLLVGVNNQLPEVGYTVALEYVFYIFFGLSLFAVATSIASDRLTLKGHKLPAKRLDYTARIVYVLVMLLTVLGYWAVFGGRMS